MPGKKLVITTVPKPREVKNMLFIPKKSESERCEAR